MIQNRSILYEFLRLQKKSQNPSYPTTDDSTWQNVRIPHDWAIEGSFDHNNDMQDLLIEANLEVEHSMKTGRTGGLPYIGVGWYRTNFKCDVSKNTTLLFDGAMSDAHVYLNGELVCNWPYGYNTFYCDITNHINKDGSNNLLAVRLENLEQSSRWYPGAGLYRNVHLIQFANTHLQIWGNTITTPSIKSDTSDVTIKSKVYHEEKIPTASIKIIDPKGQQVEITPNIQFKDINENVREFEFNFTIQNPQFWSPDTPNLYLAQLSVEIDNDVVDYFEEKFGIRKIEFKSRSGFYLNDVNMKFNGVCIHHDLGPPGSAVNKKGLRHELELLKDMGTNVIRTSHNMPAPELVELCDELGLMMMVESFDEWDIAKCKNGYHRYWKDWAEKDIINMI
ncbi:Glycosyl hydrolases family 2, immunoglobulin-like beta-sandwich domain containing protein [Trichomonas vaginalis G3]|uniref:Glycosyl hydrolases family 2, immunoglobulin-like beta-sandwich domain containing protein n=1 Tax=Trichomonas vaginalis (strain ATCC PRA-98 / G3) TaxID=412133 RepID=A2EG37_TRIV3|nr:glycosyl hydrolase [Trichomonas vaginalis G3]EAY08398.1 Glycosyl hydrolases family 2, immunoglobulin-like beta-sandwich domain containing protein [Trichomonas vaginalis G3]KAI5499319.1 beta-glucuronidase protein [Trichomonas vaginalis G3]|eukprot:XP_001320621.1 glycosyl hydrolase [Trichomonas vaginalis G3]